MKSTFLERILHSRFTWVKLGALAAVLVVIRVATTMSSGETPLRSPRPHSLFQYDAGGDLAIVDQSWTIELGDGPPMGLITAAAICGDDAFFVELLQGLVHKVRLSEQQRVATFGQAHDGETLKSPLALASDCAGLLYVVEQRGVAVLDSASGRIFHRFAKPFTFVNAPGIATVDSMNGSLYVQGLWTATKGDWLRKHLNEMFENDMLGYQMDVRTGKPTPIVPAVERGCWISSPNCLVGLVEQVRSPRIASWLAAHTVGTNVGVFDSAKHLLRTIDVRSLGFREDGRRVMTRSASIETKYAWQERNSVIRALYSFDDVVVTIHTVNATKRWKLGEQIDFEVFMNIHRLDGAGIASDVRLPDLPVARDDDSLYVLDYGPGGRRRIGHSPVTLMRIPIRGQWL